MPLTTSEVLLLAIGLLAAAAVVLLFAPGLIWLRQRILGGGSEAGDLHAESRAGSNHSASRALVPHSGQGPGRTAVLEGDEPELTPTADPTLQDRVIRIVSWAFLMAVALFAAGSGIWAAELPAIVVLVAATGLTLIVLQDVVPRTPIRELKGPLLAFLIIGFAGVLVALTGGLQSPFAFAFPLIVGAGALMVAPRLALALAILATAAYLAAGLYVDRAPDTRALVALAANLTGLYLLAYVGASVGREQRRARDAAIKLSTVDALTGLYNRTFFFAALEREIARSDRSGRAFCLVMLDLDDLKSVNDRLGHHAGDQVLRGVADVVRGGVRKIDVAARYGGDEFVALLPETDPTGGWVLAEKIRLTVSEQGMAAIEPPPTVSVGVVSYPADGRSADALLMSADRAMYASKRSGKNRVGRPPGGSAVVPIEPFEAEPGRGSGERAG
ncbi:MAG: GGDEF domain-containing protein [Chloroflexi bacterium]|nr:GGDEF domain-containing protein [Chloroflexota bacterium]